MSIKLTKTNFNSVVKDSNVPVLIDFYADWCGPCKLASPIIEQISEELEEKAKVCKVNVDNDTELAQTFGVASIPTFVIIKNNKVTKTITGLRNKQELKALLLNS